MNNDSYQVMLRPEKTHTTFLKNITPYKYKTHHDAKTSKGKEFGASENARLMYLLDVSVHKSFQKRIPPQL